ncbi:MAG: ribonuclease P protein component [bacterium]
MRRFRLDKRKAIKSNREFNEIFKTGQKAHSSHFMVLAKSAQDKRIGFTVSKRIKGSVKRNFAKRRLREIVRLNQQNLPDNKHLVFQAKQGIDRANFGALTREFQNLMDRFKATSLK